MNSLSDYDTTGFAARAIYDFLDSHGIVLTRPGALAGGARAQESSVSQTAEFLSARALLPATNSKAPSVIDPTATVPEIPEWMRRQIGIKRIALWDAAKILAGIAPSETPHPHSEKSREVDEWHYALEDAIEAGEISEPRWNEIRCEQMALHADIRAWCAARGCVWPIPDPNPRPLTDAEALAEIERLKVEIQSLTQKVGETEKHAQPPDDASKLTFEHSTSDLVILAEAAREWWSTYEAGNHTTAPKNDDVIAWLEKKGVAKRKAEVMASILRSSDIPTGPR